MNALCCCVQWKLPPLHTQIMQHWYIIKTYTISIYSNHFTHVYLNDAYNVQQGLTDMAVNSVVGPYWSFCNSASIFSDNSNVVTNNKKIHLINNFHQNRRSRWTYYLKQNNMNMQTKKSGTRQFSQLIQSLRII